MMQTLLQGELVRLTVESPEELAPVYARWSNDSEFWRLMASNEAYPRSVPSNKKWLERMLEEDNRNYFFSVRTLEDDRLIGDVGLDGVRWEHGDSFVGIAIGERELWGRGYGTEAMRLILRYAFTELNLRRVSLNTFEYNERAIRSYEKVGFKHEGRIRGELNRDGRRWDVLFMGILKEEWEGLQ